jgi:hypothetical protein
MAIAVTESILDEYVHITMTGSVPYKAGAPYHREPVRQMLFLNDRIVSSASWGLFSTRSISTALIGSLVMLLSLVA